MLTERFTTRIIGGSSAAGSFLAGTATLLNEEPACSADGWDTLTAVYAHRVATLSAEELIALYPIGTRLGTRTWWVSGVKPACLAPGVWTAEVAYKGWAGTKPAKISWGTAADQQSASNVTAPTPDGLGSATYAKIATHEATPTFTTSYLVLDVQAGWPTSPAIPTNLVGRQSTPSGAPPVPAGIWYMLYEFVYHWPNGWVLMDVSVDVLPGTTVGLVTQGYKYIRAQTP